MSTESLIEPIQTATVAVFSPDLTQILLVYNAKLDGLVPVGGKRDVDKDKDLLETALREGREEAGLLLFHWTGVFLDTRGVPLDYPLIVWEEDFLFPDGKKGRDSLYFFRLHEIPGFELRPELHWLNKTQYAWERVEIRGEMYQFRAWDIQARVLAIMQ